jgi:MFS family permease
MTVTLRDKLGLPNIVGRKRLAGALLIDSLGSGMFLPFAIVYFLRTTALPLTTVGLGLSIAAAAALPTSPLAGPAVDRLGPKRAVLASNLLQAAGFVGYLWVSSVWQLIAFALLINVGQNIYWTANGAVVAIAADAGERPRWFAMVRGLRNTGFGLGALLAALAVSIGSETGFRVLVVVNAASFVASAAFISGWRPTTGPASEEEQARAPAGTGSRPVSYRSVLSDRPFMTLILANVLFVLSTLVITVALTVYVVDFLHQPGWMAGVLFAINTALVALTQTTITRLTERRDPVTLLQLAAVLWGACFLIMWVASAVSGVFVIVILLIDIVIYTAAEIVYSPTMSDMVVRFASASQRGRYFAVHQLSWSIPSTVAPAAFTWLMAREAGWLWIALAVSCVMILAILSRLVSVTPEARLSRRPA